LFSWQYSSGDVHMQCNPNPSPSYLFCRTWQADLKCSWKYKRFRITTMILNESNQMKG
jgi:hypothetical protein